MPEWPDRQQILKAVIGALDAFDWAEADRLCRAGDASLLFRVENATTPFPSPESLELLKRLRRKRRFELMGVLADAFIRAGAPDAEIRRQYGQALIDQGNLFVAETVLRDLLSKDDTPERERNEALGLLGRIYKQHYVNASQPSNPRQQQNLAKAIGFYFEAYDRNRSKNIWQGINYVALLARARADGLTLGTPGEGEKAVLAEIEKELKRRVEETGTLSLWDRAIELEVAVARNELERIEDALYWYIIDEGADAFEYASTLRQLREVWRLNAATPPGDSIITALTGAVLKRGGESVKVNSSDVRSMLQKNFSGEKDIPLKWWRNALTQCTAIAQIQSNSGRHLGTGFLVSPTEFFKNPSGEPVLLTNWHVVSKDGEDPLSIAPENGVAFFEACGSNGEEYRLKQVVAFCRSLDASFVTLEPVATQIGNCRLRVPPAQFDEKKKQRLYVIGYPGGRGLSFSLHDSLWLDSDGTRLHYRTPTEAGNSGSPVFDEDDWMLVGLHHAGGKEIPRLKGKSGTYEANEAFSITAIRDAIATNLMS
jgi:V8-like Glu-specific endopeptidase